MSNKISLPTKHSLATHARRQKAKKPKRKKRLNLAQQQARRTARMNAKAVAGITAKTPAAIAGRYRSGPRTIGDRVQFFRTSWEANYARYLEREKVAGRITGWEYEAKTFYFADAVKPPRSYTPDFRITMLDGMLEFHEVKGFINDKRLAATLRRMADYYPYYPLKVLDTLGYKTIEREHAHAVAGWEYPNMPKRRRAKYARV